MVEIAEITGKLEKDFVKACINANGQFLSGPGHLDCLLQRSLVITLHSGSSAIKVETGNSHVEMYNVKSILSVTVPNRIQILNDKGNIIHVRPDTGIVTFNGDVKGAIV